MATEIHDAETQELRAETTQYVLELRLESGEDLQTDAGPDRESARAHLAAIHAATSDSFVYVGRDIVVRASDIRYARVREEGESGQGLIESLKSRVGGGQRMAMYDTETRGRSARMRAGQYDDGGGSNEPIFGYGNRPWAETKPFFLTSEFLTLVGAIAGVGIAMAVLDNFDANRGWLLITILAAAYMVSRGVAKAGSRDPNPRGGDYR